jgi:hypothetical protein
MRDPRVGALAVGLMLGPVGPVQAAALAPPAEAPEAPVTHDVPADDFEREPGVAPGGYYGHGTILERAPPDGQSRIVLGSILVPLGVLATVTNGVGVWATVPAHCVQRLGALGIEADDPSGCQSIFTFNLIGATQGALMLVSGATILGIGLVKRQRYHQWRTKHGLRARLDPMFAPMFAPGRWVATGGLRIRF